VTIALDLGEKLASIRSLAPAPAPFPARTLAGLAVLLQSNALR
jgi:hypothetical protein